MPFQGQTPEGRAAVAAAATASQTATDATNAGNPLATLTVPQAEAWIDTNVNAATLAVFKVALKTIARLLIVLRDRQNQIIQEQQQFKKRLEALEKR